MNEKNEILAGDVLSLLKSQLKFMKALVLVLILLLVASVEEARAVQTDFSGALTIMPDTAHGYIYTKQLNLQTGCADFAAYSRVQDAPKVQTDYVPRGEFDELTRRFNALCDQLGGAKNE